MCKFGFSWLALIAALLLGNSGFAQETSRIQEAQVDQDLPNIVLILSDDQAWTDYSLSLIHI